MKNIGIVGISGKMGQILYETLSTNGYDVVGGFARNVPAKGTLLDMEELFVSSQCVVDFSSPHLTQDLVHYANQYMKPLIIGTTNIHLDDSMLCNLQAPVILCANTSWGAFIQKKIVSFIATFLPNTYKVHIQETHHQFKKDAPSGTSKELRKSMEPFLKSNREISIFSSRIGDIAGEHHVSFIGPKETLTFAHLVNDSSVFSDGVIQIIQWLEKNKPLPKIYGMEDIYENPLKRD